MILIFFWGGKAVGVHVVRAGMNMVALPAKVQAHDATLNRSSNRWHDIQLTLKNLVSQILPST